MRNGGPRAGDASIRRMRYLLPMTVLRVGLISDTHGLLRSEALRALRGCAFILHAGDVGAPEILEELGNLATVFAVRGNTDRDALASRLRKEETIEIGRSLWYMRHDLESMDLDPAAAGVRVVVSGHTHRPAVETRGGVLFLNPGSAGPRRSQLPASLALVDVHGDDFRTRMVRLG